MIGSLVVADNITIKVRGTDTTATVIVLLATYYAFDMDYPRQFSQVLGTLQDQLFDAPFLGTRSEKFKVLGTKI